MADVLAAVSFGDALTAVVALVVVGIGINMAFKGSAFGKRAIKAA